MTWDTWRTVLTYAWCGIATAGAAAAGRALLMTVRAIRDAEAAENGPLRRARTRIGHIQAVEMVLLGGACIINLAAGLLSLVGIYYGTETWAPGRAMAITILLFTGALLTAGAIVIGTMARMRWMAT